jgi:hypothetical protein
MFLTPTAGVIYQVIHYLVGLRRLGYDPYYVEDPGSWFADTFIHDWLDTRRYVDTVANALEAHGFAGRWAFRNRAAGECLGLSEAELRRLYREADAFLNVTGDQQIDEEQAQCPRRIYIEADPFAVQVLAVNRDPDVVRHLDAHDVHFTYGENVGNPDCAIPVGSYHWLPTRQPVIIDFWSNRDAAGDTYRSITTWRDAYTKKKAITFKGQTYYWDKGREFVKYLDLPRRRTVPFELAVNGEPETSHLLREHGWRVVGAETVSRDLDSYRTYDQGARAEFTVARDQYVRPRTGWFSDRSACFLAAGRPVVTQETGFSKVLPVGRGLFSFETMDDVLEAVDAIESDYATHSRAAAEIGVEFFAAEKVLAQLLERAGL